MLLDGTTDNGFLAPNTIMKIAIQQRKLTNQAKYFNPKNQGSDYGPGAMTAQRKPTRM